MSVAVKTPPEPVADTAASSPLSLYRFTVEQFQRMVDGGVLTTRDRVELLEGWIVEKMTQNPPHAVSLDKAHNVIGPALPSGWYLREQKPIVTPDSQPEPDLAVVRGPEERYLQGHPGAADIAVLIEVAEASLEEDREYKGRLYARAHITCYWIINLRESLVEVYTKPRAGKSPAFRQRRDYSIRDAVPLVIEGQEVAQIAVRDLLP
jgi:Uma2 family endonuclease